MPITRPILAATLLLPFAFGCASSGQPTAHEQDNLARERAFQFSGGDTLAQRATFDLNCPQSMMQAQVIQRVGMFQVAASVGVRGCGRQTTYVRGPGSAGAWLLNGPVAPDPSYQPPQAPPTPSAQGGQ